MRPRYQALVLFPLLEFGWVLLAALGIWLTQKPDIANDYDAYPEDRALDNYWNVVQDIGGGVLFVLGLAGLVITLPAMFIVFKDDSW